MAASEIPAFYRTFFRWIDPCIAFWGTYNYIVTPDEVVNTYIPRTIAPRDPNFDMLLYQLGGYITATGIMSVALLRYTSDVGVWKIFQGAVLVQDLALLYGAYDALAKQGTLHPSGWRVEDWGFIGITVVVSVIRAAFVAGVGFKSSKAKGGKAA